MRENCWWEENEESSFTLLASPLMRISILVFKEYNLKQAPNNMRYILFSEMYNSFMRDQFLLIYGDECEYNENDKKAPILAPIYCIHDFTYGRGYYQLS